MAWKDYTPAVVSSAPLSFRSFAHSDLERRIAYDGAKLKVQWRMKLRPSAIVFLVFVGLSRAMCAQQGKTPTLDEILQRLEANLSHYDKSVPNLFCDEHVVSQMRPAA